MRRSFLGITRERVYSPGKVDADRAILDAVAERLALHHDVRLVDGERPLPEPAADTVVFAMCQGPAALAVLRQWSARGIDVINPAAAIEGCHRHRMLPAFERAAVRHPPSVLATTAAPDPLPRWADGGAWIKRGDVHATETGDVVHVANPAAAAAAFDRFHRRGIVRALAQQHVPGVVIKFYAVRGTFFRWFPPAGATLELAADELVTLRALAEQGAAALGLEIFGGDCVRRAPNDFWLIDLNDWPSYAPCRATAAEAISAYLAVPRETVS